jgi:two-component system, OmpR family, response regulator MprA
MSEHILLIEDEPKIAGFISRGLRFESYSVEHAADGTSGMNMALSPAHPLDLIILDVMLPDIDGLKVCRNLRQQGLTIPIIMLTARDAVTDRIAGLDAGADDYLVKPFAFDELLARIRAQLRRQAPAKADTPLEFNDLSLNPATRRARRGNREIELTAKEYELLEFFLRNPNHVLTRDMLYDRIWGYDFGGESNILEVYIRYLRSKLEAGGEPRLLQTVRGMGYALREA